WYDKNQCHHNDPNGHDRTNGRIFRIGYGTVKARPGNLQALSDLELANLLTDRNSWQARHAQRILQERAAQGALKGEAAKQIESLLIRGPGKSKQPTASAEVVRLRALWTL